MENNNGGRRNFIMADFIQSKVYLIHQTQAPKPTNDTKPTQPKTGGEITEEQNKPKAPNNNTKQW